MGTAAVFAIASETPGKHYTTILGCTMDGFHDNLKYLAHLFAETSRELQCLTMVRKNKWNSGVGRVLQAISDHGDMQWFQDKQSNAAWVSYSAIYNPKNGRLCLYEGMFEYQVGYVVIPVGKATTADSRGKMIAKKYKVAQKVARMTPEERQVAARLEEDRKRREAQKAREEKAAARKRALAKLSTADRAALGL